MTARKIRRLELTAGAPRRQNSRGVWAAAIAMREAERDLARQAEHADAQTIRDRQAAGAIKAGASATPGRASQQPSTGKAARQTTRPSALHFATSVTRAHHHDPTRRPIQQAVLDIHPSMIAYSSQCDVAATPHERGK